MQQVEKGKSDIGIKYLKKENVIYISMNHDPLKSHVCIGIALVPPPFFSFYFFFSLRSTIRMNNWRYSLWYSLVYVNER